jgi:acetone carboxylase gamma subunit
MSEIVPSYTTGPLTTLSEIVCPQCGALLDAEVTMQGAGPLLNDQSPEGRP